MSKRISNKQGRSRKTPARSLVKYGWRKTQARALAAARKTHTEDDDNE